MLFYVVMLLALITETLDVTLYVLSWMFVLARYRARLYPCDLEPARSPHRRVRRRRHRAAPDVGDRHRPHPAVRLGLMTPAARASAAIEILADIEARKRPAAEALKDWGTSHRFAGSGDRAAIGNLVFDCLRARASAAYAMGEGSPARARAAHAGHGLGDDAGGGGSTRRWRPPCAGAAIGGRARWACGASSPPTRRRISGAIIRNGSRPNSSAPSAPGRPSRGRRSPAALPSISG